MQVLPSSTGRRSASGALIFCPSSVRLPDTIIAMASMAADHVCCTWVRGTVIVASQMRDSFDWDDQYLECSLSTLQDQHLRVKAAGDLTMGTRGHLATCSLRRDSLFTSLSSTYMYLLLVWGGIGTLGLCAFKMEHLVMTYVQLFMRMPM